MKQYQKLFEMDGVKLKFTKGALHAVAKAALERKPARAACAPSSRTRCSTSCTTCRRRRRSKRCVVNEDVIDSKQQPPLIVYQKEAAEGGRK